MVKKAIFVLSLSLSKSTQFLFVYRARNAHIILYHPITQKKVRKKKRGQVVFFSHYANNHIYTLHSAFYCKPHTIYSRLFNVTFVCRTSRSIYIYVIAFLSTDLRAFQSFERRGVYDKKTHYSEE